MNTIAGVILILFFPAQYYLYGFFTAPENFNRSPAAQVEGATSEKYKSSSEKSLKGRLSNQKNENSNYGGSGLIPERKKDYYNTKIFAGSSVVIDVDSGTILHYDNGRGKIPIASLTKIMTAVLVLENVKNLDEPVTVDEEALSADGTKVGCPQTGYCVDERLHIGEKVTVGDLLMAMLLDSANDAAIALGKYIAGSQKDFAGLMNDKAKDLSLMDSHFCNPSGLDEDDCYSSAYDIARIAAYSMQYEKIWKIMKTPEIEISSTDGKYTHKLKNTDLLLDQIPNCLGGKTGFTYNAGKSLMMAAADPSGERHKIIAVILNDNERWADMKKLIDWTFENYNWK
ncbi:MAG: D-alanyl-D-alanine carboxypeptidase family protein [Candidatus Moranbacteria bacterium]|nr:D-alanyl-D-alanine carboxypeptidase family protein [Candidatus Moranbacteria bacterium]